MRTVGVHVFLVMTLLASAARVAPAQQLPPEARLSNWDALGELERLADDAHKAGRIDDEISIRASLSEKAWADSASNPKSLDEYELYDLISFNDMPLAVLLEGTNHWTQAEKMFRHNQAELAHMRIAGDDIKSQNQLLLAYLLTREGQQRAANAICHHWQSKVRHLADGYLWAMKHDVPEIPPSQIADTNEIEVAAWDLACGASLDGLTLAAQQKAVHPFMLRSYEVLREYYAANGESERAREEEKEWDSAVQRLRATD
ncbi:MAG: hypothetical protein WCA44_19010 [Acidobacteriaceae bacterium]